jgi:hypothetical protein
MIGISTAQSAVAKSRASNTFTVEPHVRGSSRNGTKPVAAAAEYRGITCPVTTSEKRPGPLKTESITRYPNLTVDVMRGRYAMEMKSSGAGNDTGKRRSLVARG